MDFTAILNSDKGAAFVILVIFLLGFGYICRWFAKEAAIPLIAVIVKLIDALRTTIVDQGNELRQQNEWHAKHDESNREIVAAINNNSAVTEAGFMHLMEQLSNEEDK